MMKATLLVNAVLGVFLVAAAPVGWAQAAPGAAPAYVDENATDPAPLKLEGLEGNVRGLGGDAMAMVWVSLFTEQGHALVATVVSDRDGKFKFTKVDKGLYRVVAQVAGLCPANIPVRVESSLLAHHRLEITMRPKEMDTCSYGMAKK
jgi:hypothetical protein